MERVRSTRGTFQLIAGTLYGNDIDAGTLTCSAPMLITGPGNKLLYAGRFTVANNDGTSIWDARAIIYTYYAPTFSNTGSFDLRGDV